MNTVIVPNVTCPRYGFLHLCFSIRGTTPQRSECHVIALAVLVKNTDVSFFLTGPHEKFSRTAGGVGLLNGYRLAMKCLKKSNETNRRFLRPAAVH